MDSTTLVLMLLALLIVGGLLGKYSLLNLSGYMGYYAYLIQKGDIKIQPKKEKKKDKMKAAARN